ncbi:hypothetical protein PR048_009228 [Dryococelus australis]|uniref:PiggyBac transposable element-derived protein domain-containing protein n=1 Tax=Dryococelus australis TaxID=614101 RepID=A0ABQ9HZA5_9NEOP|nr:hypothetical protein PR048_009228 [Dryococelus australis]
MKNIEKENPQIDWHLPRDLLCEEKKWQDTIPDPPSELMSPFNYFSRFYNEEFIENIAYQSSKFVLEMDHETPNFTTLEIEQYLGILLYVDIIGMLQYRLYWLSESRYPPIADIMETVLQDQPPEEMQSIDEQIISFKGHSNLHQYVKTEPHKWGYKVFTPCGSSGMTHSFQIYEDDSTCTNFGIRISGNIVIELASTIPEHKKYKLYFDNWFSSISLAEQLQDKGIWCVGTIRENSIPNPPLKTGQELKKEGREAHNCAVNSNSGIVIFKWFDNKAINKHIRIPRPAVVSQYNKFMGGVDLADMLIELYHISMKSKRGYMRIFHWKLNVAVINSWLLYCRHHAELKTPGKNMSLLQFQAKIAVGLTTAAKAITRERG